MINYDITNFIRVLEQIKTKLLKNDKIVSLMTNIEPNCLTDLSNLDRTECESRMSFTPVSLNIEDGYNKQVGLVIQLTYANFDDKYLSVGYELTPVCHNSVALLDHKKNRLLELTNEIIKTLQNEKFAPTTTFQVDRMNLLVFDEDFTGYRIVCSLLDNSDEAEY